MQKLLLIEDDESFVSIFDRYFAAGGYEVLKAPAVEEALASWREVTPDLVVASCRIMEDAGPRVRGALVRQAGRTSVPMVASGTWADRDLLDAARANWADETFSRPTHPERIWDIVRKFLGHVDPPQVQIDLQRFALPESARLRPLDWSDEILEDIVYLIYEVSGNFLKKRERLCNMIEKRMRDLGVTRLFDYDRILRRDSEELANLIDLVTVNETFFFRNREQFDALRDDILPGFAQDMERRVLHRSRAVLGCHALLGGASELADRDHRVRHRSQGGRGGKRGRLHGAHDRAHARRVPSYAHAPHFKERRREVAC